MKGATVDNVIVVTPGELRLRAELSRLKESMAETGELFLDAMGDAQAREARLVEALRPLQLELGRLRHRVVATESLADALAHLRAAFSELGEVVSRDALEAVVGLALCASTRCSRRTRRCAVGENSGIEWTDHSFNPWVGCVKVSPGCAHCYAEAFDRRVGGVPVAQRKEGQKALRWGVSAPRTRTTEAYWRQPIAWNAEAIAKGARARVFSASLADVFEENSRFELHAWRLELFELIRLTPALDWQLLTKRPQHVLPMLSAALKAQGRASVEVATVAWVEAWLEGVAPPNVWLGTTVEDEERAAERVHHLVAAPAAVRFLSMEPLLERIDLRRHQLAGVHWVIVGGESGKQARVFDPDWAGDVVAAARAAGVVPFVKQLGSRPLAMTLRDPHGGDMSEWPVELRVREFPEGPQRRLVGTTVRPEAGGRTGSTVEGRSPSSFVTSP